jgi:hypothetical protein
MSKPASVLSRWEQDVELVKVTLKDLEYYKAALIEFIIERAEQRFGLLRCQPEDGPYLRLAYTKQPSGERIRMAMTPIASSDAALRFFVLASDDFGLKLNAEWFRSDDVWSPDYAWFFRRRQ